jgi:hypothetical protein
MKTFLYSLPSRSFLFLQLLLTRHILIIPALRRLRPAWAMQQDYLKTKQNKTPSQISCLL